MRNRLLRRFTMLGRLADLGLLAGAGLRLAQRQGWIGDQSPGDQSPDAMNAADSNPAVELLLAGGALWRLARRKPKRR